MLYTGPFVRHGKYEWLLPARNQAREALLFATPSLVEAAVKDGAWQQLADVAALPGLVGRALAMPDIHLGYGFPIGGVAAFDGKSGLISPGGVGYDINCGVRLLSTALTTNEIAPYLEDLVHRLFARIPTGVGSKSSLKLSSKDLYKILSEGAQWTASQGFAVKQDLDYCENLGRMLEALPDAVSETARERGKLQLGTLGAGNHFVEVQRVAEIFDADTARIFGLEALDQITVLMHSGSRGLGHQVCTDHLKILENTTIPVPNRQLAATSLDSPEGEAYFGAMNAAANYAFCNRQLITHQIRLAFEEVLHLSWQRMELNLVYDVTHNLARKEVHLVEGEERLLCVHRKGATRALGPGDLALPQRYQATGQPVLVPGSMGTASYVLAGVPSAESKSWSSACHGAGRRLSRKAALKQFQGTNLASSLAKRGILVLSASQRVLLEEAPDAYKDVDEVVQAACGAGLARLVARLEPLAVIKG